MLRITVVLVLNHMISIQEYEINLLHNVIELQS